AEHTWGMDLKTHLKDWENYDRKAFEAVRGNDNFQKLERSWCEQRGYLTKAMDGLHEALKAEAEKVLDELTPKLADEQGWKVTESLSFVLGAFELELDEETGAVIKLNKVGQSGSVASRAN